MRLIRNKIIVLLPCLLFFGVIQAQFPPGAYQPGTTAIPADSAIFLGWATAAELLVGPSQIDDPNGPLVVFGTEMDAVGPPNSIVVSLGDGGQVTVSFEFPIMDGEGWDFAVFENGFKQGSGYFLELGLVEVSSDGEQFFRFPATSLTSTDAQIGTFGLLQPENINNLAGKYELGFGTPFDLSELPDHPALDKDRITHVRIIDVVGNIDPAFATYDAEDRAVNDPWPTPFESSGFDLDAVGVIHQNLSTATQSFGQEEKRVVFPNPVRSGQFIFWTHPNSESTMVQLLNGNGKVVIRTKGATSISTESLEPGLYLFQLIEGDQSITTKIIIQ